MSPLRALKITTKSLRHEGKTLLCLTVLALSCCAGPQETSDMSWFSKWPEQGKDQLDPKLRAALDLQGPQPDFRGQPLAEVRANFDKMAAALPRLNEKLAKVETVAVEAFRVRVYTP